MGAAKVKTAQREREREREAGGGGGWGANISFKYYSCTQDYKNYQGDEQ